MDNLYIYASSNKNMEKYPNNNSHHFIIPLNKPLHLKGKWSLGLFSIRTKTKINKDFFLCCSIVTPSLIDGECWRVLRLVSGIDTQRHKDFVPVQYIPIDNTGVIDSIEITILSASNLAMESLAFDSLTCTLHMKQETPELLI